MPAFDLQQLYRYFYTHALENDLTPLLESLPVLLHAWTREKMEQAHQNPLRLLQHLPVLEQPTRLLLGDTVTLGHEGDLTLPERKRAEQLLLQLKPWRKGPYELAGIFIDTEWRSDWKWQRVQPHLPDLKDHRVLDVGCGSGYHLWRMREAGARSVLGIDPFDLFVFQFQAVRNFYPYALDNAVHCLPLALEDFPTAALFDTVFSMGVLYHRSDPMGFLKHLRQLLRPDGTLVLETLVVPGGAEHVFLPPGRYARMRNVWFLPSVAALQLWLERLGFVDVRCVDLNRTLTTEQRSTPWMDYESLEQCLDPENPSLTVEGHPAPLRAIILARRGNKP